MTRIFCSCDGYILIEGSNGSETVTRFLKSKHLRWRTRVTILMNDQTRVTGTTLARSVKVF